MKIAFIGRGTSGSWEMRAVQMGDALGGAQHPHCKDPRILEKYDVLVLVKRYTPEILNAARMSGVPIVWDMVDAWPQPDGNYWDRDAALRWMDTELKRVRPHAALGATGQMSVDIRSFGVPSTFIYHHYRLDAERAPTRQSVDRLGYEGAVHYLGLWEHYISRWCNRNNVEWVKNPARYASVDIMLALREPRGYSSQNWKSNVKLANMLGHGMPGVVSKEYGYTETACGAERWVDTVDQPELLEQALDGLLDPVVRRDVAERMFSARDRFSLTSLAEEYYRWLHSMKF